MNTLSFFWNQNSGTGSTYGFDNELGESVDHQSMKRNRAQQPYGSHVSHEEANTDQRLSPLLFLTHTCCNSASVSSPLLHNAYASTSQQSTQYDFGVYALTFPTLFLRFSWFAHKIFSAPPTHVLFFLPCSSLGAAGSIAGVPTRLHIAVSN